MLIIDLGSSEFISSNQALLAMGDLQQLNNPRRINYRSFKSPFVYIFCQASSGRETDQNKGLLLPIAHVIYTADCNLMYLKPISVKN